MKRIYWVEPDGFDKKPNKSPWLEMSEVLIDMNFDVVIVTGYALEKYATPGRRVNMKYFSSLNLPLLFRYSLLLKIFIWLFVKARRDDIIILNPSGMMLAPMLWLRGCRNIHLDVRTLLGASTSLKERLDYFLSWQFPLRYLHGYVRSYSFITERLKAAVSEEFGIDFKDYVLWQSGVNSRKFKSHKIVHAKAPSRCVMLYHGSITRNRGLDAIIEAIAILPSSKRSMLEFVIIGGGSELHNLKMLVDEKQLSDIVTFKGLKPYDEMPDEISNAQIGIYALPDRLEWNVSSPIKIFEYMACAKPIILTPIPAHKDVLASEKFIVWTDGEDAKAIAVAIEDALDNLDTLTEAASVGPALVRERFDWKVQGKKLGEYLARIYA